MDLDAEARDFLRAWCLAFKVDADSRHQLIQNAAGYRMGLEWQKAWSDAMAGTAPQAARLSSDSKWVMYVTLYFKPSVGGWYPEVCVADKFTYEVLLDIRDLNLDAESQADITMLINQYHPQKED